MTKPLIAVTLGDPAGIGPEIIVQSIADGRIYQTCRPLVIGDAKVIERACTICGVELEINRVKTPDAGRYESGRINVFDLNNIDLNAFQIGEIGAAAGAAAYSYIESAIQLAQQGSADAVATAPVNKESFRAAGIKQIGHTEIFGELTDSPNPLTMYDVRGLRVFFLSRHVSLRQACDLVKKERVLTYIKRCINELKQLGVSGTFAVAGLNPHCGEHGLFGDEEVKEIAPAVNQARAEGFDVVGPIGADSVFHQALIGRYTAVLSLYHDQGHIATKTYDFERTISVTLGLPFVRTSVDHGTAFDIAGKGIASAVSMIEAIALAAKYSEIPR